MNWWEMKNVEFIFYYLVIFVNQTNLTYYRALKLKWETNEKPMETNGKPKWETRRNQWKPILIINSRAHRLYRRLSSYILKLRTRCGLFVSTDSYIVVQYLLWNFEIFAFYFDINIFYYFILNVPTKFTMYW